MAAAIGLREDFDADALRAIAKRAKDGPQARRLLALAAIYGGAPRGEAAKIGGVTLQVVRDWVLRFNAHGESGLVDRKAPGQPSLLKNEHRAALMRMRAPVPARPAMPTAHVVLPLPSGTTLRDGPAAVISPDGSQIAYVASRGGVSQLYIRSLGDFEPRPLTGTQNAAFFSPDSRWVGLNVRENHSSLVA